MAPSTNCTDFSFAEASQALLLNALPRTNSTGEESQQILGGNKFYFVWFYLDFILLILSEYIVTVYFLLLQNSFRSPIRKEVLTSNLPPEED